MARQLPSHRFKWSRDYRDKIFVLENWKTIKNECVERDTQGDGVVMTNDFIHIFDSFDLCEDLAWKIMTGFTSKDKNIFYYRRCLRYHLKELRKLEKGEPVPKKYHIDSSS